MTAKVAVYAPARLSREPGSGSSTCCAGAYSPWPPPFAHRLRCVRPRRRLRSGLPSLCSPASLLTMTRSDFSCPCIIGFGSSPSQCGPPYTHSTRRRRPDTRFPRFRCDPFARDVALDRGRASAPRLAVPRMLPSANENPRPLRCLIFRGSIPHPMQLLCTLRDHCRQGSRNTRYQADATPYLGRTSTGRIAPALPGALILSPLTFPSGRFGRASSRWFFGGRTLCDQRSPLEF